MDTSTDTLRKVEEYYGRKLNDKKDLKTNACCSTESIPKHHQKIVDMIDDEIMTKFYGCGSPIPPALKGKSVLDLGCGTGRDVYLTSYLVGPSGRVIGVDMTDNQLQIAKKHIRTQMQVFGYDKSNVEFHKGYIENLQSIGIADNSIDIVISNCVINLSPNKNKVFSEIFRVLKPGGELYFSDVFSTRRVLMHLKNDPVLYGECLAGALYIEDFRRLLREIGILDFRTVSKAKITLDDVEIEAKAGMIDFYSMTIRAFKLFSLEDICEDYGQIAIYSGTIPDAPHTFMLDDHHEFLTGKPKLVCGNTASMLKETRFAEHFSVIGDRSIHFGPFDCSPSLAVSENEVESCGC